MAFIGFTRNIYFVTTTVVDWVDIFTRPQYKQIVVESLDYCQKNKGLVLHAWVLMTNHIHLIVSVDGSIALSDILRDFKKFSSKKVIEELVANQKESRRGWILDRFRFAAANDRKTAGYKFWQDGNYIEQIMSKEFFLQKLNYIHQNPVRQQLVDRAECYLYSSARDYAGQKGLLKVGSINCLSQFGSDWRADFLPS